MHAQFPREPGRAAPFPAEPAKRAAERAEYDAGAALLFVRTGAAVASGAPVASRALVSCERARPAVSNRMLSCLGADARENLASHEWRLT